MDLFAGIRVSDFATAREWYERLLGEPSFFPHDAEAVWTIAGHRHVYIVEEAAHAGHATVTLFVDDLDQTLAEIKSRDLEPADVETYDNGVRKAVFRDPDGNEVGFGGGP
jgi:catechol 2,3-dioxygenase-like lactoylglutathione lyase family enzyme